MDTFLLTLIFFWRQDFSVCPWLSWNSVDQAGLKLTLPNMMNFSRGFDGSWGDSLTR